MYKVDWNQVPDIAKLDDEEMKQLNKRNKFHNLPQNQWFKNRYFDKVKPQYLFYPEERRIQMELKQIFNVFDYNDSKTLDIAEMFLMFKHFGFDVSKNDLKVIYSYIDQDRDWALNYQEFKAFTENPSALKAFRNMMTKMQNTLQLNAIENKYIPLSVGAMLTHLSYMIRREQYINILCDKNIVDAEKKYEAFRNLIITKEKKTVVDDAYDLYIKAQYKLMNAKLKSNSSLNQLDVKLSQPRYNMSLSTVPGLQPQLFRNMSMRDVENIRQLTKVVRLQTQLEIKSYNSIKQILDESDVSEDEFSQKESDLQKLLVKAQNNGKQQAQAIITQRSSKDYHNKSQISLLSLEQVDEEIPRMRFQLKQQKSVPTKQFLRRQIRFNKYEQSFDTTSLKYHQLDRSPHQTTLASNDLPSNDSALFSNRPLKLPQLL
ncbi:unnamed protein product [Paramecium pentaurelia]|uniref:EF-hand domain-containing protein n=1 Tax=Paramecium pentaurelia TaxID=43138 RepID=A0A8S1Y0N0_9CILI|nr:unnamed protein product [Paramecium pentaurelia]